MTSGPVPAYARSFRCNFHKLLATLFSLVLTLAASPSLQSQTFTVIHSFTGRDGSLPQPGLSIDAAGNLYGTTALGGAYRGGDCSGDCGTVFRMQHLQSGWAFTRLYSFNEEDGMIPSSTLTMSPDGALYGVTQEGGSGNCQGGCGVVYGIKAGSRIPFAALPQWNQSVLHDFMSGDDGRVPHGDAAFDGSGNLYVTAYGGPYDHGLIYQFTPTTGGWIGSVIHSFQNGYEGSTPVGGLIPGPGGSLYGVTAEGGLFRGGTIYKLSPSASGWIKTVLWNFRQETGAAPGAGLIKDPIGNLFGTTGSGGLYGSGTVFQFTPGEFMKVLYDLPPVCNNGCGPQGRLAIDQAGNLYGTVTAGGAYSSGVLFKLTREGDGWAYSVLHDFTGQSGSDGAFPAGTLVVDAAGNLYGTAAEGGVNNSGTVFKVTP